MIGSGAACTVRGSLIVQETIEQYFWCSESTSSPFHLSIHHIVLREQPRRLILAVLLLGLWFNASTPTTSEATRRQRCRSSIVLLLVAIQYHQPTLCFLCVEENSYGTSKPSLRFLISKSMTSQFSIWPRMCYRCHRQRLLVRTTKTGDSGPWGFRSHHS